MSHFRQDQVPIALPPVPLTAKLLGDDRTSSLPVSVHNRLDERGFVRSDSASAVGQRGVHAQLYSRLETGTPTLFKKTSKRQTKNGITLADGSGFTQGGEVADGFLRSV